jgi:hypothetical protein
MTTTDLSDPAELAASLCRVEPETFPLTVVGPGSAELPHFPEQWLPIIAEPNPLTRCHQTLALWNPEFLDQLPRFHDQLKTSLVDIRAVIERDCPALVYVLKDLDGIYTSWIGYDPRLFQTPPFWSSFPHPVQTFLQDVHAGFVAQDFDACGVAQPRHMRTMAQLLKRPSTVEAWNERSEITAERLLIITTDGGNMNFCICPEEPGKLVVIYPGDLTRPDFFPELENLMVHNLGLRWIFEYH